MMLKGGRAQIISLGFDDVGFVSRATEQQEILPKGINHLTVYSVELRGQVDD